MATLWNLVLVVSLLLLSAPQRCSGVDHGSLELRDFKLLEAMQVVSEVLKCMTETIKEGFQAHEKNSAELVLMVKEQMNVQNGNIDSLKKQLTALQREDGLSQENAELKKQLANKDIMVDGLSQEIAQLKNQLENQDKIVRHLEESVAECQQLASNHTNTEQLLSNKVRHLEESVAEFQQQVSNHTNTEQLLSNKVQVLEKRIVECQEKKEQPGETLVQLNNTVAAQENDTCSVLECHPHKQEIIRLVVQYYNTKSWRRLWRGLEAVLDHSSEPYRQLQGVQYNTTSPLLYVGYNGGVQLASLLMDAGLPADIDDTAGFTLLHGAAAGGHLQLGKQLLDRGASIDVRTWTEMTPLMYAARYGHLDMVQLLVSAGADTTATSMYGRTALDYARMHSHTVVIQYLQQLPH